MGGAVAVGAGLRGVGVGVGAGVGVGVGVGAGGLWTEYVLLVADVVYSVVGYNTTRREPKFRYVPPVEVALNRMVASTYEPYSDPPVVRVSEMETYEPNPFDFTVALPSPLKALPGVVPRYWNRLLSKYTSDHTAL